MIKIHDGEEGRARGLGNGLYIWGVMVPHVTSAVYPKALLLLPAATTEQQNANNARGFIEVMQQRSARGNFLVVSRVGR